MLLLDTPQIWKGDPRTHTALCNGMVSYGAPIGVIRVIANHAHTWRQTQTKYVLNLRAMCGVSRMVYLHAHTAVHTHLTNHSYFDCGKNPKYPQLEPHAGIHMPQVLGPCKAHKNFELVFYTSRPSIWQECTYVVGIVLMILECSHSAFHHPQQLTND